MKLTQSQRQAIEYAGRNLQLIACAGSGKTEVVARRVARLLTKSGGDRLEPRNIVAFTFTNKAATELKERIVRRTAEAADDDTLGMADMYVGTIHGFCQDLLQSEVPEFLKYEALDEIRQKLYVNRKSRRTGLTTSSRLNGSQLKRWADTDRYIAALSVLREDDVDEQKLAGCSVYCGLHKYRTQLREDSYFDFSAMLESAVAELTNNDVLRSRVSERVKYVIVDEYQDVNPIQERLIRLLHDLGAGLCVVGDDDQTIYQWRGSSVGNILKFKERYPSVEQIRLEENFRSSEGVIDVANRFVNTIKERLPKEMKFAHSQRYEQGDITALSLETPDKEAEHVVETIKSLRGVAFEDDGGERGLSWSDMAILLRSVKHNGTVITDALKKANIPFVVKGLANLFQTDEASATRELFHFIADESIKNIEPPDERSLQQAWENARLGLDMCKLNRAIQYAKKVHGDLHAGDGKSSSTIQSVFLKFLELSELREENVPGERGETVLFNLGQFSQVIADWESINPNSSAPESFQDFTRFLHYEAETAYNQGAEDSAYPTPDAVQVMTVHQAKGREWPVVFLPALLRNRFPSISRKSEAWQLIPREAVENAERYDGSKQDERRLFYVAMTRSKKFLHMTWAPIAENQLYRRQSEFWDNVLASKFVMQHAPDYTERKRATAKPRTSIENVEITVTDLKDLFECRYRFKLNSLYGFNSPDAQFRMLYGKLLHDVLADIHQSHMRGERVTDADVPALVRRHLRTTRPLGQSRESAAREAISHYVRDNADKLRDIRHSEQPVEIDLGDGFIIKGRIDLVRQSETGEITIADMKATATEDNPQPYLTDMQLYMYAIGYEALTGRDADFVEIYGLNGRNPIRRPVNEDYISHFRDRASSKMSDLRDMRLHHDPAVSKCKRCDFSSLCSKSLA